MKKILFVPLAIMLFLCANLYSQVVLKKEKADMKLQNVISGGSSNINYIPIPHSRYGQGGVDNLGVIIKTNNVEYLRSKGFLINSSFGQYATLKCTPEVLSNLMQEETVIKVSPEKFYHHTNDVAGAVTGARLLNSGYLNNTQYRGKKTILCFIDSGIDWSHLDFRSTTDTTKSRILYIWDQTLKKSGAEKSPQDRDAVNFNGLNYGVEYSKSNIEGELGASHPGFVRERDTDGHGSHVAGTAVGNGAASGGKYAGIAPEADILIIKAGNGSFADSNIMDALSYVYTVAKQLNEPVIVNMSFGSLGGPNDGTDPIDKAVDNFVSTGSGRVAVIAAGNDGVSNAHITGSLANLSSINFSFHVPSYAPVNDTNNNYFGFDLWFNNGGTVTSSVKTPNSYSVNSTGTILTNDGTVYVNSQTDPDNNEREVYLYVSNASTRNPAPGNWSMNVVNNSGSTMTYHGWLFDSSMGATLTGGDSQYSISSPGSSANAITVGSYVTRFRWQDYRDSSWNYSGTDFSDNISTFSSIGPRRDGLQKPEITAPGQGLISVKSSSGTFDPGTVISGNRYLINQGTSMATPIVSGSAALLLQQSSALTASQIKKILTGNPVTDSYTGQVPNPVWGYG